MTRARVKPINFQTETLPAAELIAERLKDIDATLRAFGCEPPKGTDAAMAK